MAKVDSLAKPDHMKLSPRDLLNRVLQSGEKLSRQEMVVVNKIATQGAIFDKAHAIELGQIMQGDFGITQSALVRARFKDETHQEIVYDWMDGLHRIKGMEFVDPKGINSAMKCEVLYGCTDEEMFKYRILAADNVKSIRFARICMFINDAWQITPWKDKITATQAFYLAVGMGSGKQMINDEGMVEEIKKWAEESAKGWHLRVGTIYQDLMTFDLADPELVVKVRSGSSFQKGEMAITPRQLGMIAEVVPHQNYPEIQMLIANYLNSGLSTAKLAFILQEIKQLETINQETVLQVIKDGEWKHKKVEKIIKPAKINTQQFEGLTNNVKSEPIPLKNAVTHLNAANSIIVFSYDLQASQKERLRNQIATIIYQLQPKDDGKIQKNEKPKKIKHIKKDEPLVRIASRSSTEFMMKWMNQKQFIKLADNNMALDEFAKEISELSDSGIYNMAKLFLVSLTGGDEAKRNIAKNIFDRIPFKLIDQSYINDFFIEAAKHIKESLVESVYKREQVRDILVLVTRVIDQNFVSNKIGMSQEAEDLLFDALKSSSSYLQGQEKEKVESWVANHHYLLLEREEI